MPGALDEAARGLADFPHLAQTATLMLDELVWWTWTLRAGRMAE